ncbi:hypothetical protein AB0B45_15395 [Nonomuraea sp. NPDC049152]|uniref:hypothetical protein n=1 Tax=Nonomuraea sp. NPDC049152 TaxID=3154350 RepID=UPI0033E1D001
MLDDLSGRVENEVAFRDLLPYVLDLLAGVTRCIDDESKGCRTSQFASWWHTADRRMQKAIQDLRNAELKRVESRTKPRVRVEMTSPNPKPAAMTVEKLTANQVHIDVSIEWQFIGGDLDGKQVLPALNEYWHEVGVILTKAETLLEA